MLLQLTDVPSMEGINNAISSEDQAHVDDLHADSGWLTYPKTGTSASMVGVTLEYRITGQFIEWRLSGNTSANFDIPASGDAINQNVTTGIPADLRPEFANWTWTVSLGSVVHFAITPGGNCTLFAGEGTGANRTIVSGTAVNGQSPVFRLP
jgi:hypothetical protein